MRLRTIVLAVLVAITGAPGLAVAQQSGQQNRPFVAATDQIQGFHVVLVVGETERGKSSTENLTEAAARALKDMGEFLPYKSYRVLDAQWSSCCSGSQSRISGRLQGLIGVPGPNGTMNLVHRPYAFNITARAAASAIQIRFVLTAKGGHSSPHVEEQVELERMVKNAQDDLATLMLRAKEVRGRVDVGVASQLELREAEDKVTALRREVEGLQAKMERLEAGGETGIMDSSFTMDAGETVVVGTSKLGGDKALIAVVTAVRKGGAAR